MKLKSAFGALARGCLLFAGTVQALDITGAGATFPYPIYAKWADAYKKATGVGLNYQSIGSGGGIKQITAKTVDFGASDMPMQPEDLREERPDAVSGRHGRRGAGLQHQGRRRRRDHADRARSSPTSISARSRSGTSRRSPPTTRA